LRQNLPTAIRQFLYFQPESLAFELHSESRRRNLFTIHGCAASAPGLALRSKELKIPNWSVQVALVALIATSVGCSKHALTQANGKSSSADATQVQSTQSAAPFAKQDPSKQDPQTSTTKTSAISAAISAPELPPEQIVVPSGTPITVRLLSTVSSASAHAGDEFEATLDQPIVIDGKTVAAEGSQVTGRVVAARHSGRLRHPGFLRIALTSLTLNGKAVPVRSSSVVVAGGSHKRRNLAWIGGGGAGGALIGGIASGGTGALIGTAIGAAGGTTAAFATGKKDVGFAAERRLTFRQTREVTVS
jgi:hypothetical protein